jgi:hypothetical protein
MASKNNNPKGRENDIVVQELKGEVLLFDLNTNKAYCLNQTSALVWNLCDGESSVSDISRKLSQQLKQPVTEDLVWLAVDGLKKDDLLEHSEELTIRFDGLSRREVIRKVGFASMIALPVIASLVTPTAAMAQSLACTVSIISNTPIEGSRGTCPFSERCVGGICVPCTPGGSPLTGICGDSNFGLYQCCSLGCGGGTTVCFPGPTRT